MLNNVSEKRLKSDLFLFPNFFYCNIKIFRFNFYDQKLLVIGKVNKTFTHYQMLFASNIKLPSSSLIENAGKSNE